jgi:hypothetical protein
MMNSEFSSFFLSYYLNNAFSVAQDRIILVKNRMEDDSEWWIGKEMICPILRYYLKVCLEDIRNICQNDQSPDREIN